MTVEINDDFDLEKIDRSGQCFRWERTDGAWRVIGADRCVYVSGLGENRYAFDCSGAEWHDVWAPYFDLGEDYRRIRERIDPAADPFLWEAQEHEKGIRILRQDPWEMLITSVIMQNRNIPAIRKSVELLCGLCGERKTDRRNRVYAAFPTPRAVASLSEKELTECRLGYRWKYVFSCARAVSGGELDLGSLREKPCEDAVRELTGLYGVGGKVACCAALFGLHHLDAFPRDVWIRRALEHEYPDGYPFEAYSPYNGVYQQYIFAYYRRRMAPRVSSGQRRA